MSWGRDRIPSSHSSHSSLRLIRLIRLIRLFVSFVPNPLTPGVDWFWGREGGIPFGTKLGRRQKADGD